MAMVPSEGTRASKRARHSEGAATDAQDGAEEVGSGLPITRPPRHAPHIYNNTYTVDLTYADNYRHNLSAVPGTNVYQVWRSNSIFDPDSTGIGHQPLGRDLWASMYDYYAVLSCEYDIKIFNCSGQDPVTFTAVGTSGQIIGAANATLLRSTDQSDITGPAVSSGLIYPAAEMKNSTTKVSLPGQFTQFKGTLTPGDFLVDAKDADNDNTWTANGSNPSVSRYFGYVLSPMNFSTLAGSSENPYITFNVQAILRYTVQFTQINPSLRQASS